MFNGYLDATSHNDHKNERLTVVLKERKNKMKSWDYKVIYRGRSCGCLPCPRIYSLYFLSNTYSFYRLTDVS